MNFWTLLEDGAWFLAAVVAAWMLFDAYRIGRDYDEEFLVHTIEDLDDDIGWQRVDSRVDTRVDDVERPHS